MSDTDRYAVIGHPIAHSKSPIIHQLFAKQTGEQISYEALDVPPEQLRASITKFTEEGGKGLNVTVPHKRKAAQIVDIPDVLPQTRTGGSQALKIVVQVRKVHQRQGLSTGLV